MKGCDAAARLIALKLDDSATLLDDSGSYWRRGNIGWYLIDVRFHSINMLRTTSLISPWSYQFRSFSAICSVSIKESSGTGPHSVPDPDRVPATWKCT